MSMENNFETLSKMGIENVHDIEKFTSRTEGEHDILKIYFQRHHGDWFAKSKKFKFPRVHKDRRVNEGLVTYRPTTEPSAIYLNAVEELEKLVATEKNTVDKKALLLEEIDHLEKVVQRKIIDIRRQIEEL
ncbi:DUF3461 family protein [Oceanospirillum maris]|uniref:DUF3461 family protein n=1 Tax=Oceanospirillum maris TaxID=64977 RepID=UPI000413186D|nr:DUF3461 family protein [Oceanospirillum maris]